jgi:hypothetical protein
MPVNSISPSQAAQTAPPIKKTDPAVARRQDNIQESNKVNDSKDAAKHQARVQKAQEPSKVSINTSGQKIGTRINTSA